MKKSRKKSLKKFIKYNWISMWLTGAIVALAISCSFAAYTNISSVKRVVSTQGGVGLLFSSNYLNAYALDDSSWGTKRISISDGNSYSISVSVCNYEQGNTAKVNSEQIDYVLTATLVDKNGNEIKSDDTVLITDGEGNAKQDDNGNAIRIKGAELFQHFGITIVGSDQSYSFTQGVCTIQNQVLPAGIATRNVYRISIEEAYVNDVYVKVCARPVGANNTAVDTYPATESRQLARVLSASVYSIGQAVNWSGRFTDPKYEDAPYLLDGFNYELSGNGQGTVTLIWDHTKVEISPWFLAQIGTYTKLNPVQSNMSGISFQVDSDYTRSYKLQFYRVVPSDKSETQESVKNYVTCSFEAQSDTTQ
jgi:hypothetical protein